MASVQKPRRSRRGPRRSHRPCARVRAATADLVAVRVEHDHVPRAEVVRVPRVAVVVERRRSEVVAVALGVLGDPVVVAGGRPRPVAVAAPALAVALGEVLGRPVVVGVVAGREDRSGDSVEKPAVASSPSKPQVPMSPAPTSTGSPETDAIGVGEMSGGSVAAIDPLASGCEATAAPSDRGRPRGPARRRESAEPERQPQEHDQRSEECDREQPGRASGRRARSCRLLLRRLVGRSWRPCSGSMARSVAGATVPRDRNPSAVSRRRPPAEPARTPASTTRPASGRSARRRTPTKSTSSVLMPCWSTPHIASRKSDTVRIRVSRARRSGRMGPLS